METRKRNRRFFYVLTAALLLLAGAVWLNIKLNAGDREAKAGEDEPDSRETMVNLFDDYFNSFRSQRSAVRAQEIDYLRSIINAESTDEASAEDARMRLVELVSNMEKEFTIESLIRSKGFLDAAATLGNGSATVVINGDSLSDEEVARILDVIISETGLSASNVKISLGAAETN